MATGPPTGGPGPLQVLEQTPPPTPSSWDGDRMFNIYIYDYCMKRGYTSTARELTREADIPQDSAPPINAKQGLLFEWWSVFWVLFTAKSSGLGPEDALLYTQTQQAGQRQPPRQPLQPAQRGFPVNGPRPAGPQQPMPNGVSSVTAQPGPPPMPNGTQGGSFGPGPQPNGIAGPSHPTGPSIGTPAMIPGQRAGPIPPQRAPNGAPFQSPTMAHSPQHSGAGHPGPQQQPMNVNMGPQGTMQLRGTMPPPGPPQGLMGNPQQPAPAFQPLPGSSASHPNSPAAHGVSPSPSFAHRQLQMQPGPNANQSRDSAGAAVNTDFMKIDSSRVNSLKEELGLGHIDIPSLSMDDKAKLVNLARERGAIRDAPKPGAPHNAPPGPPNRMQPTMQPNQQRPLGAPFAQQGQNPQRGKRNSSSPGNETEQGQNDSSPPANKRPRTSPTGTEPQPPMAGLGFPPMHGGPGNPQHPQNVMMPMMPGASGSFASGPRMNNPPMAASHIPGNVMQYRQTMTAIHKLPGGGTNMMPTNTSSPAAMDTSFDGSRPGANQFPGNRPPQQQNKPQGMMPPPSPGPKKEPEAASISSVHSSPRNLPAATGGHGPQQQPPQQTPGTAPPTPAQNNAMITAPSPSSNMGNNQAPGPQGPGNNQPPLQPPSAPPANNVSNELFMPPDFMQQLGMPGFEFSDTSLFQSDQMGTGGEFDLGGMVDFENPGLWPSFS